MNGSNKQDMIPPEYLPYVFYVVAIGLAIKAVFQITKAYKGDFLSKFHLRHVSNTKTRKTVKWVAYAGLVSRAILIAIVSYFFFVAASSSASEKIKGTSEAFSFIRENSEGPWLVGLVALGLICYGVYMLVLSKFRNFEE